MKKKLAISLLCLTCLLLGFFLFPLTFGKKLNEEYEQIVIYNKIGVLDSLIVELYRLDDVISSSSTISIICEQLKAFYQEADKLAKAHIDILNPLDYGKEVEDRLNQLAIKYNAEVCPID